MVNTTTTIVSHNIPELLVILNNKYNVKEILKKERKFEKFEGVNFVYKYKITFSTCNPTICEICGFPIKGQVAWYNQKKVCRYCFRTKTKGYHSAGRARGEMS